jgi:hypothetical protein
VVGSGEHGNETSGFIKGRKYLDWLGDCKVHKKGFPMKSDYFIVDVLLFRRLLWSDFVYSDQEE